MAPDLCLDLTQETFLGIYRGLEGYRPEARFEAWLYRIATTTHLKWVRARTAEKRSGVEVATESLPEEIRALGVEGRQLREVLSKEEYVALAAAVDELPEQMRRCLELRLYHELSYREVATVLKISVQTVKAHLHQARGRLREKLRPETENDPERRP